MRMIALEVIEPPAELPVTVDEFIDHGRLNGLTVDRQPALIERELTAATQRAEEYLRRSLITQKIRAAFIPDFVNNVSVPMLVLPRGNVQSVTGITSQGQTIDPAGYSLEWNVVTLQVPLWAPASVVWVSGYGDEGSDVPDLIREGILQYASVLYEFRLGGREQRYAAMGSQGLPDGIRDVWRQFQIEISG